MKTLKDLDTKIRQMKESIMPLQIEKKKAYMREYMREYRKTEEYQKRSKER